MNMIYCGLFAVGKGVKKIRSFVIQCILKTLEVYPEREAAPQIWKRLYEQ